MRRIAIIGNGAGGKSALARDLGRALDLPVHTVDVRSPRELFELRNRVLAPRATTG